MAQSPPFILTPNITDFSFIDDYDPSNTYFTLKIRPDAGWKRGLKEWANKFKDVRRVLIESVGPTYTWHFNDFKTFSPKICASQIYFLSFYMVTFPLGCADGLIEVLSNSAVKIVRFHQFSALFAEDKDKILRAMGKVKSLTEFTFCSQTMTRGGWFQRVRPKLVYVVGMGKLKHVERLKLVLPASDDKDPSYDCNTILKTLSFKCAHSLVKMKLFNLWNSVDPVYLYNFLENCRESLNEMNLDFSTFAYKAVEVALQSILKAQREFGLRKLIVLWINLSSDEIITKPLNRFVAGNLTIEVLTLSKHGFDLTYQVPSDLQRINANFGCIRLIKTSNSPGSIEYHTL